ncbi:alpha-keto acid decarboxylase family protein [Dactylosporangium sp. CA-139066]|uniref:alpha-keto acid decarboxylase family protein n=1 Tax=Dactylosporangium sp. CA-139066 TaxID=3239930 RepID=UPI003D93F727
MADCTVGDYLLRRLRELGIRHVFGVPGDYQLEFLDQLEATDWPKGDGITWVGNCNELNAAYAADGYARLHGIGAVVTTFGVGELSALNGVGGAYAEQVPLVSIVGMPATFVIRERQSVHHTTGDGDFTRAAKCAAEFTVAQALLSRDNAAAEIDRALSLCWLLKRPVYLMLPADVAGQPIPAPAGPLELPEPTSDPAKLAKFTRDAQRLIGPARSVAVLVGHEVDRYRLGPRVVALAEALDAPVACLSSAKGVFPEGHELFAGGYAGQLSDPETRRTIEDAECLIAVGTVFTDSTTGGFTQHIDPERLIELHPAAATVAGTCHSHVAMADALDALTRPADRKPHRAERPPRHRAAAEPDARLAQNRFWPLLGEFLEPGDVIIAEQGTCFFGAADIALPRDCTFFGQPLWGSIGYTLPALLGSMLAAPDRRHVLLIGDGSFQLTAQELATVLRLGLNPVIVLVNNDGYTVERCILGPDADFNGIARWRYDRLVEAFDPAGRAITVTVRTEGELTAALDAAAANRDRLVFVEAVMDRLDAPESVVRIGKAFAASDYHHAPV